MSDHQGSPGAACGPCTGTSCSVSSPAGALSAHISQSPTPLVGLGRSPVRPSPLLPRIPRLGRTWPDYLAGGGHPEVLKGTCLPPGPGDELVQARGVQARVRVRQGPQGAPARGLALHAEPQDFQLFQVAEG